MTEQIKKQILFIRDTGLTNMFDFRMVKFLAGELDMPELVEYININPSTYAKFIMTGKVE